MEDNADSRAMVTYLMKNSDIAIAIAKTIDEAESMALSDPYDVFLLDGIIPFKNSLALCRRLRAHAPETPILFYSAFAGPNDIAQGLEAGANDYLIKPYSGDLIQTLWQAANQSQATKRSKAPLPELAASASALYPPATAHPALS
jgi:DNA-binding response OmpR family regulator